MADQAINISEQKGEFRAKVQELLPDGGNLNICLTCGTCAAGCPATGLEDMDPRKFVLMVTLFSATTRTGPRSNGCAACASAVSMPAP